MGRTIVWWKRGLSVTFIFMMAAMSCGPMSRFMSAMSAAFCMPIMCCQQKESGHDYGCDNGNIGTLIIRRVIF